MIYTLTLQDAHYNEIKNHLIREDGLERVAYIICGRSLIKNNIWNTENEERFLSKEVIIIPDNELIKSTSSSVKWKTNTFVSTLKKIEEKELAIALIHNHPSGSASFSSTDNEYEPELFRLAFNRNESERPHLSLVITPEENLFGRIWNSKFKSVDLQFIRIIGKRFKFIYEKRDTQINRVIFHRQQLAFGEALSKDLSRLKIGIVGCGATGSAIAMLISRLGIGNILLIDKDIVEHSNLNRLHGAKISDADAGLPKVKVLSQMISDLGLGINVRYIQEWANSVECINALKSCDIVFGCTDDNNGRLLLNRLAYIYLIPIIDMGLAIEISKREPFEVLALDGRISVVYPPTPCLLCRDLIDIIEAREEYIKRTDFDWYEKQKEEAYVKGEKNPSPSVVTFTTELATMAVNELLHRIQGFRGDQNNTDQRIRKFHNCIDITPKIRSKDSCKICGRTNYWGRGDMIPLLDIA